MSMPLVVCTIILIIIFSYEWLWFSAKRSLEAKRLLRYEQIEHPRHHRSDRYLDFDWT